MNFLMYCIYDKQAAQYSVPRFTVNSNTASREFAAYCRRVQDQGGDISDYTVYLVGEFDISTAELKPFKNIVELTKGE